MYIFTIDIFWLHISPSWYGFMYAVSFLVGLFLIRKQFSESHTDILFFSTVLGVILWWRIGYVLLYNFWYYTSHVLEIFMPWKGGMSFHGWVIWVIIAWYCASRKIWKPFLVIVDKMIWMVPIWLFFGRIGNFLNGELFGLPGYDGFFAQIVSGVSYFPTPLFEAFFEGIILLLILFFKRKNIRYSWQLGVWFLFFYGVFRCMAEFLRMPDVQIGYIFGNWMTLGHLFSIVMIIMSGIFSMILRRSK